MDKVKTLNFSLEFLFQDEQTTFYYNRYEVKSERDFGLFRGRDSIPI